MSKKNYNMAEKRFERARDEYISALKALGEEEEVKMALERCPEVDLRRVTQYAAYYQGARKAFMMMNANDPINGGRFGKNMSEDKIYRSAIYRLVTQDIRYTEMFMAGQEIGFCNHQRDKKGKLVYCDACFLGDFTVEEKKE